MTEEQNKLVLENIPLIHLMIKELHCKWKTEDEYQEYYDYGLEGLIKGAKSYDVSKGKPSTYLCTCIGRMIQRVFYLNTMSKRYNPAGKDLSLNKLINDEDNSEFGDFIEDPDVNVEADVERKIEYENLLNAINSLKNFKDRIVVKMYYGLDGYEEYRTCEAISRKLGVSKNMVNMRLHRAIKELKVYYLTHDRDNYNEQYRKMEELNLENKEKTKNNLVSLNDALFAQLDRLSDDNTMKSDDSFKKEMERSKAITGVAHSIIANANLILNSQKFMSENGEHTSTPKLLSSNDE